MFATNPVLDRTLTALFTALFTVGAAYLGVDVATGNALNECIASEVASQ